MIGIDTNVLLRFLVNDDPVQSAAAKSFVDRCADTGDEIFIGRVVLCEAVWVLLRAYRYDRTLVAGMIEALLSAEGFDVEDHAAVGEALALWRSGGAGFADALIGCINRRHGCATTVTFDRQAARLADFQHLT
ncbi:PIN domain-containing protein [Azospirillum halopraeferens]|uniref:PIN domain-containing protein n=1 Tax=Azospirillum halopraeferens TaxID=34010 RepID=UPI0004022833|nr:type II toxin-antitoxin system VapC family toxin [Azospirillum halopraeferens]